MPTAGRFLVAGLGLVLAAHLQAAVVVRGPDGILFQGEIQKGDYQKVTQIYAMHGSLRLDLASPGGLVDEALKIAEFVRSRGVNTNLRANSECASACVLILAGGVVRTAHPSARIGIHMGSGLLNDRAIAQIQRMYEKFGPSGTAYISSRFEQQAALSTLRQVSFYLKSGVSLRLLELAASVDHLDIRWLSTLEAKEFNLLNAE